MTLWRSSTFVWIAFLALFKALHRFYPDIFCSLVVFELLFRCRLSLTVSSLSTKELLDQWLFLRNSSTEIPLLFLAHLFAEFFFRRWLHRSRTAFSSFSWKFGQWISFRLSTIASQASPRAGLPFFAPKYFLLAFLSSCSSLYSIGLEWNNGKQEVKHNA